jgi:hypothetical protein
MTITPQSCLAMVIAIGMAVRLIIGIIIPKWKMTWKSGGGISTLSGILASLWLLLFAAWMVIPLLQIPAITIVLIIVAGLAFLSQLRDRRNERAR